MQLNTLDHVNVRTANLEAMVDWYCTMLGMTNGDRPPFRFPGAWLYAGNKPVLHLIGVDEEPASVEPKIEHFAMSATGLQAFIDRLDDAKQEYEPRRVPGYGILQINLHDVDGNHIHIDFSAAEADAAGL